MFLFDYYFFDNFFLKNRCPALTFKNSNPENHASVYKSAAFAEI